MTIAPFTAPTADEPVPFTFHGQHPLRGTRLATVVQINRTPAPSQSGTTVAGKPIPTPAMLAAKPSTPRPATVNPTLDGPDIRFTATSREALERFGLERHEVFDLIADPSITTPDDQHTEGREVRYSGDYGFICAIDDYTEHTVVWVIGVFERNHADGQAPESLREVERSMPRYAGAGNATGTMPTSFEEIVEVVRATDGWDIDEGRGKHNRHIYSLDGKHRQPIPTSTSDYRSIRNCVAQLRAMGLDVRRPAGGQKR